MTDYSDDTRLSTRVDHREPCPKCGSPDNLVVYDDGHAHCFTPACGYHRAAKGDRVTTAKKPVAATTTKHTDGLLPAERLTNFTSSYRGIKPETLRRYEYQRVLMYGREKATVDIWPLYDNAGNVAHQKVRFPTDDKGHKEFAIQKGNEFLSPNECQLFGRTVWGDQHDKRVVVTEGEIDAMSVAQCASFKYPVVSVNGGAPNAAAALRANYKWLDRFAEIILWLDDDEQGRTATAECVKLFEIGKVKIAKVAGFKDANDALRAGKFADIENAVYSAVVWRPTGIVNARDRLADVLNQQALPYWEWPFPDLQKVTRGAVRGKLYYHVAGTGVGKSTVIIEALNHFVLDTGTEKPAKIGYIGLETDMRELLLDLLSPLAGKRLKLDPEDDTEIARLFKELFGTGRWELFDPQNAEWSVDAIYGYVNYLARALGCNIIVIDPLSAIAALMSERDERVALDRIGMTLARKAKELGVNIHVAHHLTRPGGEAPAHEEGGKTSLKQVRGSGGLANHADGVLGYERNQQAETEEAKLVTLVRVLKWRLTGYTGIGCYVKYDNLTGRTVQVSQQEAQRLLGDTESHGNKAPPTSEFHGMDGDETEAEF